MASVSETRKIMTKPLPQIIDEIEDSIRLADEAGKNAREAAAEARKAGEKAAKEAALEARRAGELSIGEATKVFNEHIAKIEATIKVMDEHTAKIEATIKVMDEHTAKIEATINKHIAKVEQTADNALQLAELLKSAVMDGIVAVDQKISPKAPGIDSAPQK